MDFTPSHRLTSRLDVNLNQVTSASAQPIPVFAVVKRRSALRNYPRCVLRGFYDPEVARGYPHMWTADEATVECYFSSAIKVQYIWLEVGNTAPQGSSVDLYVDDELVAQRRRIRGRGTICAKLARPRVFTSLSLGIKSTTFVPGQEVASSDDGRDLGIALRAVVFGKRKTKYRPGTHGREALNQRVARVVRQWWIRKAA